tara:strand:+ start:345 stop:521 length:177 start_codon:yes stop_codon:yes gene_type:complete
VRNIATNHNEERIKAHKTPAPIPALAIINGTNRDKRITPITGVAATMKRNISKLEEYN